MTSRYQKALKATALLLVAALLNLPAAAALAAPAPDAPLAPPQAVTARLTTRGNQPVTVNGNTMSSGATILTGSTIETGDQVGATINLGPLGTVDLAPNTRLKLDYDTDGNVRVTLFQGCLISGSKKNAASEVIKEDGTVVAKNDKGQGGVLDVCLPKGAPNAIVNQGAAANAGAGAGIGAAGGGSGGLNTALVATLLAGGAGAGIIAALLSGRGDDPSPM
ncbi:MAG TPA: hypothetical protein VF723_16560 [Pyrinomonadaceae bacterium]|jgi:hypothetical protein